MKSRPWLVRRVATRAAARSAQTPGNLTPVAQVTRREFIERTAGTGMLMALPAALAACAGGDGDSPSPPPEPQGRTLFFNLSHENHAGKTYWLTGGGRRYRLTPVAEAPDVLRRVRATHRFLRGVPDDQITHQLEGAVFATDSVTLAYVSADIDAQAGTWSMSSTQLLIPPGGSTAAFARARRSTGDGALPMSAKRRFYGLGPATSEQDLSEERDLLDTVSHAATLVGCHPDLMGLEPNSAYTVHANHIDRSIDVYLLGSKLAQSQYGAAQPQQSAGQPNATGWATLQPVLDQDGVHGAPLKNQNGQHKGRIQYQPSLHPDLRTLAGSAMQGAIPAVKDDTSLGADVSGLSPQPADLPNAALAGAMWLRRDGFTHVDQSPSSGFTASNATMALKQQNPQNGYMVSASSSQGTPPHVSLTLLNWFLEFRGVFLQFLDASDPPQPIPLASIPEYGAGTIIANHNKDQDTATEMFVSVIGPVFTVFAIPTAPGFVQPSFNVPQKASTVRVLSSSLSYQGGNTYPETVLQGAIMTGVFNYGVTAMLAAAGAGSLIPAVWKAVVIPLARTIVLELITVISTALNPSSPGSLVGILISPGFWIGQALVLAKTLVTQAATTGLKSLIAWLWGAIGEGTAEDAVPVAGEIMQAISIAVGVISLAETSVDLALTPWTYVDDLVFTHDLSVTILKDSGNPNANPPDPGDDTFPKAANSYTVTAMFDDGTPYVQTFALPTPVPSTLPPVVFSDVPLGGSVNVSVAFVQKAIVPGEPDIMLGKGSTGLIPNTEATTSSQLSFAIQELKFPIASNTVYQHKQKTTLDANGSHVWAKAPAPSVNAANTVCGGAGTICGFRSITVRQATRNARGYLGYAWQGQNSNPAIAPGCVGGGVGQLDQVANLSTDSGANGANAQLGYANASCGIGVPGVRIAYSLLSHGGMNFYLDTTDPNAPTLRQVQLEPAPQFQTPLSNMAWGVLNFPSDTLLLHPAGHLVSINNTSHKIETHRLPKAPLADPDAKVALLAQPKSGKGSRPGLLDSPAAAAVSPDGVILILESGNNRIQAFDLGANPVKHFSKQPSPYSLTLSATDPAQQWQYLDLAVEFTGYIYVLSYKQDTFVYRLDIYHPDQAGSAPIATTQGIYAARLTVDFWRSVYTLNYEVLKLPAGAPAGLTEPSVSLWTPCDVGQTC